MSFWLGVGFSAWIFLSLGFLLGLLTRFEVEDRRKESLR